jgi:sugar lactone lactonase YvrE
MRRTKLLSIVLLAFALIACKKVYFRKIKEVMRFGDSGSALGQLRYPRDIRTDNTYLYIADYGNNRVQRFSIDTREAKDWWGLLDSVYGWHTADTEGADGLAYENLFLAGDTMYVGDSYEIYKIQISTGTIIAKSKFDSQLERVDDFCVDAKGNVFVLDDFHVIKLNSRFEKMGKFGGYGSRDGQIEGQSPEIDCDKEGNVYVAHSNLSKFDNKGQFLKNTIVNRKHKATSICFANDRMYHHTGKFVEYTTDGKVLKRWGDFNNLYENYCVVGNKIFSLYSNEIVEWRFRPDK